MTIIGRRGEQIVSQSKLGLQDEASQGGDLRSRKKPKANGIIVK
jgi:hypothetical protein